MNLVLNWLEFSCAFPFFYFLFPGSPTRNFRDSMFFEFFSPFWRLLFYQTFLVFCFFPFGCWENWGKRRKRIWRLETSEFDTQLSRLFLGLFFSREPNKVLSNFLFSFNYSRLFLRLLVIDKVLDNCISCFFMFNYLIISFMTF